MRGYFFIAILLLPFLSYSATIPLTGTSLYYPNASTIGFQPGDTLQIVGPVVSQVYFANLYGDANNHVTITAAPGVVIGGGTNRNLEFSSSRYVNVYGLTIQCHDNALLGIKAQYCSDFVIRKITIDSASVGLQFKCNPDFGSTGTNPRPPNPSTWYPNFKMFNLVLDSITITNCRNEGFYIGHTFSAPDGNDTSRPPPPLYGLSMTNCSASNTGWDGIQITNTLNIFMSNVKTHNTGLLGAGGQSQGITIQDRTQGYYEYLTIDTVNAAGLNLNNVGPNLYKFITVNYPSYGPHSNGNFGDNRTLHGIPVPFNPARQLFIDSMKVTSGSGNYAFKIQNGTGAGLYPALVGQVRRLWFQFDSTHWISGVSDPVNNYVGGTVGSPITTPNYTYQTIWYKGAVKDVLKTPSIPSLYILPLDPMFVRAKDTIGYLTLRWDTTRSSCGKPLLRYNIYRSLDSVTFSKIGTTTPFVTSLVDNSVTDSAYYYYTVKAETDAGESYGGNSIKHQFIEPPPPPTPVLPSAPSNLSATGGNGFVNLSWAAGFNGNSPLTAYSIYRSTTTGTTTFLTSISPSTPAYTDNTVTNETRYYYTVTESNVVGESPKSNETSALPTAFTVPTAPTSPVATPGTGQVVFSWSAPLSNGGSTITNYKIYRGTNPSGAGRNLIRTVNGTTFTITDTGRTAGTTYYYVVSAVNATGESPVSTQVSATPN